jgi:hypothetical protein
MYTQNLESNLNKIYGEDHAEFEAVHAAAKKKFSDEFGRIMSEKYPSHYSYSQLRAAISSYNKRTGNRLFLVSPSDLGKCENLYLALKIKGENLSTRVATAEHKVVKVFGRLMGAEFWKKSDLILLQNDMFLVKN